MIVCTSLKFHLEDSPSLTIEEALQFLAELDNESGYWKSFLKDLHKRVLQRKDFYRYFPSFSRFRMGRPTESV